MDEAKKDEVYVPSVPHILPFARMARDSDFVRDVLVFEEKKRMKPRMSWYDPYDTTWVPSGWFTDGGGSRAHFFLHTPGLVFTLRRLDSTLFQKPLTTNIRLRTPPRVLCAYISTLYTSVEAPVYLWRRANEEKKKKRKKK